MTIINTNPDRIIQLGYEGEDRVTVLRFRYGADWLENGEGIFHIRVRRHGEHTAYNAQLVTEDPENNCLLMTVTNTELSVKGSGEMQVVYSGADFVKKSPIYSYNVSRAVDEAVDPPTQDVYTQIIESLSDLQTDVQGKADVQTVSALADEITDLNSDVQGLQTIVQGKADTQTVTALSDVVSGLQTTMQGKADVQTVTALSGTVSSLSDTTQQYMEYTNSAITDLQDSKASKSYVDGELATKADVQTVTALSGTVTDLQANKADKTYVDTQLATKASTQTVSDLVDDVSDLQTGLAGKVGDVQINGSSIVSNGMANVPIASGSNLGVVKINTAGDNYFGVGVNGNGELFVTPANSARIKAGVADYKPITVYKQHESTFYGLAKVAGHDEKNSTLPVGQYTDEAKSAIQTMLDVPSTNDVQDLQTAVQEKADADVVNLLKEQVYNSYPNVEAETASVVSITDGADGIPVKSLVVGIEPVQAGSGDPSPDNVRPITGWTGAVVERCGKNLLDIDRYGVRLPITTNGITWTKVRDGVYHAQGTATGSSFFNISFNSPTNVMPCISFRGYRLFLSATNPTVLVTSGYFRRDGSYTQLSNGSVIPDEAVALRAYLKINPGITIDADFSVQLELGSTITAYEPYHADTYSITFPAEAGTVYGGSLDVLSGVLTVDRAMVMVDGSNDETWQYYSTSQGNLFRNVNNYSPAINASNVEYFLCSEYKPVAKDRTNGTLSSSTAGYLDFINNEFNDLSAWKAAINNRPIYVVYPIATPITYQLTPQEVRTLLGQNNIWADTGDTSLAYRADTKLYVDGICADCNSMLAPVESTYIATRNYTTGGLLIVDNTLYKVTANIANGGTITAGTNVVSTTLSEVIASLS